MTPVDQPKGELSEARVREILDGCEGVTPGPWTAELLQEGVANPEMTAFVRGSDPLKLIVAQTKPGAVEGRYALTADYIARLDPDTVRALCNLALTALTAIPAAGPPAGELAGWTSDWVPAALREGKEVNVLLTPKRDKQHVTPLYLAASPAVTERVQALTDVAAERERQKSVEGEGDDV